MSNENTAGKPFEQELVKDADTVVRVVVATDPRDEHRMSEETLDRMRAMRDQVLDNMLDTYDGTEPNVLNDAYLPELARAATIIRELNAILREEGSLSLIHI